ncbi:MAG: hypothetical protein IH598_01830 [Bacteroidales bacterium]|nr:hypothetical protein [Bacteroidales bacterium]
MITPKFDLHVLKAFLAIMLILATSTLNAQVREPKFTEDEKNWSEYNLTGWRFGINMGMYFANKGSAQFYSGLPQNENNIAWVLNNYYWYQEIRQELNSRDIIKGFDEVPPSWNGAYDQWRAIYNVPSGDTAQWWIYYPESMKYDAAISPGFYVKYNFNNTTGIFIQSNYVKLKTSGAFQLVIDSITGFSEPALRQAYIRGEEERINIDLGISKFYRTGQMTSVFIETGFHFNSTEVLENRIQIGNKEYSIVNNYLNQNYVPNSNQTEYSVYQGGMGYGIFFNGGLKFILTESISIDPGVQLYWKKINLTGYEDFGMSYYTYIRMIFSLFGEM